MKKYFLAILLGLIFIFTLALLSFEKHLNDNYKYLTFADKYNCYKYSVFSSSFYFIKNKLQHNDINIITIPGNSQMIRIIMNPDSTEKNLLYDSMVFSEKTIQSFFVKRGNKLSQKESVAIDNFVGYKFDIVHQYLVAVSVIIFLAFICSILLKTKNL